jgi:hypothetical protein
MIRWTDLATWEFEFHLFCGGVGVRGDVSAIQAPKNQSESTLFSLAE